MLLIIQVITLFHRQTEESGREGPETPGRRRVRDQHRCAAEPDSRNRERTRTCCGQKCTRLPQRRASRRAVLPNPGYFSGIASFQLRFPRRRVSSEILLRNGFKGGGRALVLQGVKCGQSLLHFLSSRHLTRADKSFG